jgi:hypothetical protein
MTDAGDLFSSPQPVTAKPVHALTLSRALRGSRPAEGVGRDGGLGRRGRLSPQGTGRPRRCLKNKPIMLKEWSCDWAHWVYLTEPESELLRPCAASASSVETVPPCSDG